MVREKPADLQFEIVDTGTAVEPRRVGGKTRYELIDGERRWRGVGLIPESRRPFYRAKLIVAEDDVVQYLISGITNFNREGHTAIETMRTIDRHLEFGFPMKEIANLLGISEHWARQMHGLKNLKPEYQKLLNPDLPRVQQLPIMAAVQISKIEDRLQDGLVERVLNKDITLGRLRGEVVKVAEKAGSYIRVREKRADQEWISFGKQLDTIARTADDAEALISKGAINRFVNGRPQDTKELLRKVENAKESLSAIETAIRQARSR